jgi:hypothetical protein
MARSLEGKKFFKWLNNGVCALVRSDVYAQWHRVNNIKLKLLYGGEHHGRTNDEVIEAVNRGLAHIPVTPYFTFVPERRLEDSPWHTGDKQLLGFLLTYIHKEGGYFEEGRNVYVPFSNGAELGLSGLAGQEDQLKYVTTDQQFADTFGISAEEIQRRGHTGLL